VSSQRSVTARVQFSSRSRVLAGRVRIRYLRSRDAYRGRHLKMDGWACGGITDHHR